MNEEMLRKEAISYIMVALYGLRKDQRKIEFSLDDFAEKIIDCMKENDRYKYIKKAQTIVSFNQIHMEFWITKKQAIAYAVETLNHLQKSGSKDIFTYDVFINYLIAEMQIVSPSASIEDAKGLLKNNTWFTGGNEA